MFKKSLIIIPVLLIISLLYPVQVKKIEVKDFEGFVKGTFDRTGVTHNGELFLSLKGSKTEGPEREYYLSADVSAEGDIYLGTGHTASVFRIGKDGKISEWFKTIEPDIFAVHYGSDKSVYAGSSPRGKLYKISPDLKVKEWFDPEENYIWDIKEDRTGNIICAVGGPGGIYRIDKEGNPGTIFTPGGAHVLSLYISKDNSILAGSGDEGILYRISSRKAHVIYDSPFEEVNSIYEDPSGDVWFSASRELKKKKFVLPEEKTEAPAAPEFKSEPREKSALYVSRAGGEVEKIWSSEEESIYSISPDKRNGGILIGTGDKGRIYRVNRDKSFSLIFESESAQVYKITETTEGILVIGNNTSSITKLGAFPDSQGSYTSKVFNLDIQSKIGKLYWDPVKGGGVSIFFRSGNTSSPDSTWTDWSPPYNDSENTGVNRSGLKFFQVRVNLNSSPEVKAPGISGFRFYYVQNNLKPEVKQISFRLPGSGIKTEETKKPVSTENKPLIITWKGEDPNRDRLKYSLFLKKISGSEWISFKENLTETRTVLDMELFEDGDYSLRIIADDSLSNSPETSGTFTAESKKFTIDSTAPVLNDFTGSGEFISFNVSDQNSIITGVLYSFTGKMWFPLDPDDGINDSKKENFRISKKFASGKKILFIKVSDQYDNSKVFQREL